MQDLNLLAYSENNDKKLLNKIIFYFKDVFKKYIKSEISLDDLKYLLNYEEKIRELSLCFPGKAHDIKGLIVLIKNIFSLKKLVDENYLREILETSILSLDKLLLDETYFTINEIYSIASNLAKLNGLDLSFSFGLNNNSLKGYILLNSKGIVLEKKDLFFEKDNVSTKKELMCVITNKPNNELNNTDIKLNTDVCNIVIKKIPIGRIILNTFKNAKEAGATKVDFTILYNNGNTVVKVKDNGPGMSEKVIKDVLFKKGVSTKKDSGQGIGMYELAKTILISGGGIYLYSYKPGFKEVKFLYDKFSVYEDNIIPRIDFVDRDFSFPYVVDEAFKGTKYVFVCKCDAFNE